MTWQAASGRPSVAVMVLVVVSWRYLPTGGKFTDDEEVEEVAVVEAVEIWRRNSFAYAPLSPMAAAAAEAAESGKADGYAPFCLSAVAAAAAAAEAAEAAEKGKVVTDVWAAVEAAAEAAEKGKVVSEAWAAVTETDLLGDIKVVIHYNSHSITPAAGNGDGDLVREDSAWKGDLPPPPPKGMTSTSAAAAWKAGAYTRSQFSSA